MSLPKEIVGDRGGIECRIAGQLVKRAWAVAEWDAVKGGGAKICQYVGTLGAILLYVQYLEKSIRKLSR